MELSIVRGLDRGAVPVAHDVHSYKRRSDGEQNPARHVNDAF